MAGSFFMPKKIGILAVPFYDKLEERGGAQGAAAQRRIS